MFSMTIIIMEKEFTNYTTGWEHHTLTDDVGSRGKYVGNEEDDTNRTTKLRTKCFAYHDWSGLRIQTHVYIY